MQQTRIISILADGYISRRHHRQTMEYKYSFISFNDIPWC